MLPCCGLRAVLLACRGRGDGGVLRHPRRRRADRPRRAAGRAEDDQRRPLRHRQQRPRRVRRAGADGQEVFFHVASHGYEFPKDGFGYRGVRLKPDAGGEATVKIKRINIAERLYRITGGGIYRDTVLLGRKPPTSQPVLNAQVLGQDSVQTCAYRGKIYWFWGDTNKPAYPLGNFHMPGRRRACRDGLDPTSAST